MIIAGIVFLFFVMGLSGCNWINNSYITEKSKFVGTWTYLVPTSTGSNYSFTYYFFSNGTFIFHKPNLKTNGTFDIIDGNLWLNTNTNGTKQYDECTYVFSENNTKLTINRTLYTKQ